MKTILVPTDFSTAVIEQVESLIRNLPEEKITLLFFHSFSLPGSEQDLVGQNARPHVAVLSEHFRKACVRLKEKFPSQLVQVGYRYLYGNSRSLLLNFLEHHEITHYFIPEAIQLTSVHPRSNDLRSQLTKSGIPLIQTTKEILRVHLQTVKENLMPVLEKMTS